MKIPIFLLLFFCSFRSLANDNCINAVSLIPTSIICGGATTKIMFDAVSPTPMPANACVSIPKPDFWLHLNVPNTSTGSYMIRRRAGTTIEAQAEVLYKSGCAPGGTCCEFGMTTVGCFNFEEFPNAIILENPIPGDYYIRVWDASSANSGTFVTSAHLLSPDINDWVICDDVSGEGSGFRANQLILQPSNTFDVSIYHPMFEIIDSCPCANPPLLLFQASDFDIFTEGRITAQNDPEVEGTGYNYKMEFGRGRVSRHPCDGGLVCAPLQKYVPDMTIARSRLAIIDSGINSEHEAFEYAHWFNDDPMNPESCMQVTSIGYDFRFDQETPEDSLGHGSWVAGTVIEDFPTDIQLELMSLKFFSDNDDLLFDAVCALHYAIDQGASTIVCSWGFRSSEFPSILDQVLEQALKQDVLVVSSAGNLGLDNDDPTIGKYPANAPFENVISVTAFDDINQVLPDYANFGAIMVDLAAIDHVIAPGSVLAGTTLEIRDSVVGTSISAPRVARTAAIIKAYYPILDVLDIRQCILNSVKIKFSLNGLVATGGVLNHDAALACANGKAVEKECVQETISVVGTLINDAVYKTSTSIHTFSIIEPFAKILMQAGNQVSMGSGFEVKNGAEFEANNQDCTIELKVGNHQK